MSLRCFKCALNMNNLRTILVICCLIGILITVNSCKTPNSGVYGSCKSLRYCDPLKQTLTRRFGLKDNYDWQNGAKSTQMSNFLKKYSILCKNNKVNMKFVQFYHLSACIKSKVYHNFNFIIINLDNLIK